MKPSFKGLIRSGIIVAIIALAMTSCKSKKLQHLLNKLLEQKKFQFHFQAKNTTPIKRISALKAVVTVKTNPPQRKLHFKMQKAKWLV
jgi:hypothetical protein